MRYLVAIVAPLLFSATGNAQVVGGIPGKGMDIQAGPYGFVTQLPPAPPETKGTVYLNPEWAIGDVTIYNHESELMQLPIRLDLQSNNLEINSKDQIKILAGGRVKQFSVPNLETSEIDTYINARGYSIDGIPVNGFFKVIDKDGWELLSKPELKLVEGGYVAALDAGDKNNRLIKKEVLFFSKDFKLYKVHPSTKKFTAQFGEHADALRAHMKNEKLSLKDKEDLEKILSFLNSHI